MTNQAAGLMNQSSDFASKVSKGDPVEISVTIPSSFTIAATTGSTMSSVEYSNSVTRANGGVAYTLYKSSRLNVWRSGFGFILVKDPNGSTAADYLSGMVYLLITGNTITLKALFQNPDPTPVTITNPQTVTARVFFFEQALLVAS